MTKTTKTSRLGGAPPAASLGKPTWRARLRTFGWVAFITVLIFVWADLEQTTTQAVTVTVRVAAPPGSDLRVVSPAEEGEKVSFRLRGPQGRIKEFIQQLSEDADIQCVVQVDPEREVGEYYLNLEDELNKWDRLYEANLKAEAPQPANLAVRVDRWKQVTAKVKLPAADAAALAGPPVILPESVRIRVPASRYEAIKGKLEIETEQLPLTGVETGKPITQPVRLKSGVEGVEVEFVDAPQVMVTFEIRGNTDTRSITTTVHLLTTPDMQERIAGEGYVLSRDPNRLHEWRLKLTISGPRKEIDRVEADPSGVWAFVPITESDLEYAETYPDRPVTVVLPPPLKVTEPTAPKVHFKFVKTDAALP